MKIFMKILKLYWMIVKYPYIQYKNACSIIKDDFDRYYLMLIALSSIINVFILINKEWQIISLSNDMPLFMFLFIIILSVYMLIKLIFDFLNIENRLRNIHNIIITSLLFITMIKFVIFEPVGFIILLMMYSISVTLLNNYTGVLSLSELIDKYLFIYELANNYEIILLSINESERILNDITPLLSTDISYNRQLLKLYNINYDVEKYDDDLNKISHFELIHRFMHVNGICPQYGIVSLKEQNNFLVCCNLYENDYQIISIRKK